MSIRRQITGTLMLVSVVPALVLVVAGVMYAYSVSTRERDDYLAERAADIARDIDTLLLNRLENMRADTQRPELARFVEASSTEREHLEARVVERLQNSVIKDKVNVNSAGVLSAAGLNVVDTSNVRQGRNESEEPYFRVPIETGLPYVSGLWLAAGETNPGLYVSNVIRNDAGEIVGVLRLRFEPSTLQQVLTKPGVVRNPDEGAVLFDETGMVLAHTFEQEFQSTHRVVLREGVPRLERADEGAGQGAVLEDGFVWGSLRSPEDADSRAVRASVRSLETQPWRVVYYESAESYYLPAYAVLGSVLLIVGVSLLFSVLAIVIAAARVARPIVSLTEDAEAIGEGNLERLSEQYSGELGSLARTINVMTDRLRGVIGEQKVRYEELRRARTALESSEEQVRLLLDSTTEAIYAVDEAGLCTWCNPACTRLLGYVDATDIIGQDMHWLCHTDPTCELGTDPESCTVCQAATGAGYSEGRDTEVWNRSGEAIPVDFRSFAIRRNGNVSGSVVSFTDVRERKRIEAHERELEEQLRHSQKLEAVGQLAGGIAHDFNNLLQAMMGYGELLYYDMMEGSKERDRAQEILNAGERAKSLVAQLLAFSRHQMLELAPLKLDEVIMDLESILQSAVGDQIDLHFSTQRSIEAIDGDKSQLEQVIMNLCINARDAMSHGGMLTVSLATVDVDEGLAKSKGMAHRGRCVRLSVSDTGEGIPAALQSRIFDPFFTTKGENRGTGLGLSTVFGIVGQHGGMIDFESWERVGTRFDVYFPVSTAKSVPIREATKKHPDGGSETVLLVDDDYRVRDVGATILKNAGYTVLMAEDGARAVDVFGEHAAEIDVVLLDVMMPGLNGQEVANHIRRVRPEVPIVFCSGYSSDVVTPGTIEQEHTAFIQKPYSRSRLLESLRQELGVESTEAEQS